MKETKDHLDIDLGFLDKKDAVRVSSGVESDATQTSSVPKDHSTDTKYNWKNILIVCGIIIFFLWVMSSGNSDSTSSQSMPKSEMFLTGGKYNCTQYHHDRSGELEPSIDQSVAIDAKTDQLSAEGNRLESEKVSIESEYVDEYNQWSVSQHNNRIDLYNAKSDSYQARVSSHKADISAYNDRVVIYNNYLAANCNPTN